MTSRPHREKKARSSVLGDNFYCEVVHLTVGHSAKCETGVDVRFEISCLCLLFVTRPTQVIAKIRVKSAHTFVFSQSAMKNEINNDLVDCRLTSPIGGTFKWALHVCF